MTEYTLAYTGAQIDTRLGYASQDVGTGASPTHAGLTINGDITVNNSGTLISSDISQAVTTDTASYERGMYIDYTDYYVSATKTNSGYVRGLDIDSWARHASFGGTLALQEGIKIRSGIYSTALSTTTITTSRGVYVSMYNSVAGATITNAYLFEGYYATNTGTTTHKWGVYISNEDKNYLSKHLGMGSTDIEDWDSNYTAIEGDNGAITFVDGGGYRFLHNMYRSSSWLYKTTAAASLLSSGDGNFIFYTSASGTINTVVTLDEKFKINHTGIGCFGVTPQAQQSHIIDADGTLADITTKFNTLLADLEGYGLLAAA